MSIREINVWLEVGSKGRSFKYQDGKKLGIALGDIVLVSLRGRKMHGIVIGSQEVSSIDEYQNLGPNNKRVFLTNIEALVQKTAVDPAWRDWLEYIAIQCHISSFLAELVFLTLLLIHRPQGPPVKLVLLDQQTLVSMLSLSSFD